MNHIKGMLSGWGEKPGSPANFGFGLGFGITTDLESTDIVGSVGTYSWGGAAGTVFWIDPKENLAAVAMIQLFDSDEIPLRNVFQVLTYSAFTDCLDIM